MTPAQLAAMLKIISPVRPQPVRMASGLGSLAETLRGGTQPTGVLLNQLRGKPGVKPGALQSVFGHLDPDVKLSPKQLSDAVLSPKLFAQRSMSSKMNDDAMMDATNDLLYGFDPRIARARQTDYANMLHDIVAEDAVNKGGGELGNEARRLLAAKPVDSMANDSELHMRHWESNATRIIDKHYGNGTACDELFSGHTMELARELANQQTAKRELGPFWGDSQRTKIVPPDNVYDRPYFETVLRGQPSMGGQYMPRVGTTWNAAMAKAGTDGRAHFGNQAQLGHVRGSVNADGKVFAEELQSDPIEEFGADNPALTDIYGKLGRMLIDRSAEAGAPGVAFPSAERIASVRDSKQMPFFKDVYDKQLGKQLYSPLQQRGIPFSQEDGWMNMELTPELTEAIKGGKVLDYRHGGLAHLAQNRPGQSRTVGLRGK